MERRQLNGWYWMCRRIRLCCWAAMRWIPCRIMTTTRRSHGKHLTFAKQQPCVFCQFWWNTLHKCRGQRISFGSTCIMDSSRQIVIWIASHRYETLPAKVIWSTPLSDLRILPRNLRHVTRRISCRSQNTVCSFWRFLPQLRCWSWQWHYHCDYLQDSVDK